MSRNLPASPSVGVLKSLLPVLLLAFLLVGCGGGSSEEEPTDSAASDSGSSEETVQGTTTQTDEEAEATTGALPEEEGTATGEEDERSEETSEEASEETSGGSEEQSGASPEESEERSGEASEETSGESGETSGEASVDDGERDESAESTAASSGEVEDEVTGDDRIDVDEGPPFVATAQQSGGSSTEANGILSVRYGVHQGFERAVIDLASGSNSAGRVPEWSLSSPDGEGYVRLSLPSVDATQVSDGAFSGSVLRDFYVVRSPDGGIFVDLIAEQGFLYRVMELPDPARLVVDLQPSGVPLDVPLPVREGNTVLMNPGSGAQASSPLTISGYSRNFEANNTIMLEDSSGEVIAEKNVQSNDWSNTWGYFDTTLDFPTFEEGTLRVGSQSARDGSFEGVSVPLSSR